MTEITIKDLKQRHIEAFLKARREIKEGYADFNAETFAAALSNLAVELEKKAIDKDKFNVTLAQYTQGLLAMDERRGELSAAEMDGVSVRAAARCGWFGDDLKEEDVPELTPYEVDRLSTAVADTFNAAYEVPKN